MPRFFIQVDFIGAIENTWSLEFQLFWNLKHRRASKDPELKYESINSALEDTSYSYVRWAWQKSVSSIDLRIPSLHGHFEVLKLILEQHFSGRYDGAIRYMDLNYALENASSGGHLEIVKYLLEISPYDLDLNWALINAGQKGHLEIVKFLIASGGASNVQDLKRTLKGVKGQNQVAKNPGRIAVANYLEELLA